jgi:hypothetical protein
MRAFDREKLKSAIQGSVIRVYNAQKEELDLYRNTLDCFSASIDSLIQGISLDKWMIQERERQVQKTKQNAIGSFHEEVMGSIDGVEQIPVGDVIDIKSERHCLVAEIKNKHNTTKGYHKIRVYEDLSEIISRNPGFVGYYVEVLPKGQGVYNKPFVPSDNKKKKRAALREDIRVIDGRSFYHLLTGFDDAIDELYSELPSIVSEVVKESFGETLNPDEVRESSAFYDNFNRAYGGDVE